MHIQEYIGRGIVFKRLRNQLNEVELSEFNALADLHPELRQELVYAYDLLTSLSASCPPDQVTIRFKEEYERHLQRYRTTTVASMPFAEMKDVSHRYKYYHKSYRTVFYSYLIFLSIVVALTLYFYLRSR